MKFTKFMAASLAALILFSCSKEMADVTDAPILKEGDARIVIDLGQKTTYSTIAKETEIINGSGRLFKAVDGSEIAMTDAKIENNKFTAIVPAGSFDVSGTNALLYLYVNGTPVDITTASNAQDNHAGATVSTVINRDLTNGAPAGIQALAVEVKAGVITVPTAKLKRAIARVEVRNGSKWYSDVTYKTEVAAATAGAVQMPITGYKVAFANVNLSDGGALYAGIRNAGSLVAGNQSILDYTITGTTTGMTNGNETLAYMYPSAGVEATVTPIAAGLTSQKLTFDPEANRNYFLTIVPFISKDGVFDYTVEIEEAWDNNLNGGTVDFNTKTLNDSKIADGGEVGGSFDINWEAASSAFVFYNNTTDAFSQDMNDLFNDFPIDAVLNGIGDEINTYAVTADKISSDGILKASVVAGKLKIERKFNYHKDAKYDVIVSTDKGSFIVKFIVKGAGYDKNMYSSFNGLEIMNVGSYNNNWAGAIAEINALNGATFAEKMEKYLGTPANRTKVLGTGAAWNTLLGSSTNTTSDNLSEGAACPKGFTIPTWSTLTTALFAGYTVPNTVDAGVGTSAISFASTSTQVLGNVEWSKHSNYWSAKDANNVKLIFADQSNIMSSDRPGGKVKRVVLWGDVLDFQHVANHQINNYLRCVKVVDNRF